MVLAVACLMLGLLLAASIAWFYLRSDVVGGSLLRQARRSIGAASCSGTGGTTSVGTGGSAASGVLQAPSIGLSAPVVQGTGDAQLDVAVGHDPSSAWPGSSGRMVLAAHDVTWFSQIDRLRPGDTITFAEPCRTYVYTVTGARVVAYGSPIADTTQPTLALVTCYPLNALYVTSQRYVLFAALSAVRTTSSPTPALAQQPVPPTVPAPPALAAEGLSLADNEMPLGTMQFGGTPALSFEESPQPMQVEASVLSLFFGALRSAGQQQPSWWAQLAPTVPMSAASPLAEAGIAGNDGPVTPTLDVDGTRVLGATLTAHPELSGGPAPGTYDVTMRAAVNGGTIHITAWEMSRQG